MEIIDENRIKLQIIFRQDPDGDGNADNQDWIYIFNLRYEPLVKYLIIS